MLEDEQQKKVQEDEVKTVEQKLREAKKLTEGLIPTRHGEGAGMTASGENSTITGQLAAIDDYVAKVVKTAGEKN